MAGVCLPVLAACDTNFENTGYGRLIDYDCQPVSGAMVVVNNRKQGKFPGSGFDRDNEYLTDANGNFTFAIVSGADAVEAWLPDEVSDRKQLMRRFERAHPVFRAERKHLLKTSAQNPVYFYSNTGSVSINKSSGYDSNRFGGSLLASNSRGVIGVFNSGLMSFRIGKFADNSGVIFDALDGGDIAPILSLDARQITLGSAVNRIELYLPDIKPDYLFYVTYGDPENAAIVSLEIRHNTQDHRLAINHYSQIVPAPLAVNGDSLAVNLEECGGALDRGVKGFAAKLGFTEEHQKPPPTPLQIEREEKEKAVRLLIEQHLDFLKKVDYIETVEQLEAFFAEPEVDEKLAIELIRYDNFKPELFSRIYEIAKARNWDSLIHRIGRDPRVSDDMLVDIIRRLPLDDKNAIGKISTYLSNPSARSGSIAEGIRVRHAAGNAEEGRLYPVKTFFSLYYLLDKRTPLIKPEDKELIQAQLEKDFALITDPIERRNAADDYASEYFATGKLLEETYFEYKNTRDRLGDLRPWLNHPDTPLPVLEDIYRETGANFRALLDHPNASADLRNRIFARLDDPEDINNRLRNAIGGASSLPLSVLERYLEEHQEKPLHRDTVHILLKNPSLPLAISEELLRDSYCPDEINKTYASVHFKKLPGKNCSRAALLSDITPEEIKAEIIIKYGIDRSHPVLKTLDLPTELFQQLYTDHPDRVTSSFAQNPNTPPEILIDIFNTSKIRGVNEYLGANPSTPVWILQNMFDKNKKERGDFKDHQTNQALFRNPALPLSIRKQLEYPRQKRQFER